MSHDTRTKNRLLLGGVSVVSVLIGLLAITPVTAQTSTPNPGNPSVLDAVHALQTQINSLMTAITTLQTQITNLQTVTTDIQTSVQTITPAESNVRVTPAVFVPDNGGVLCSVTNVSNANIRVKMELYGDDFGFVTSVPGNFDIKPQEGTAFSRGFLSRGGYHCRFEVVSAAGSRTNIRAIAMVVNEGLRFDGNTLAAE